MGGFCTQSTTTLPDPKSVISGTQIPEWTSAAGQQIYEQAAEIAASPFPEYTGARIATYGNALDEAGNPIQIGTNPDGTPMYQQSKLTAEEIQAGNILSEGAESYQPFIDKASAMADTLGQGYDAATREELIGDDFSIDAVTPYMDIYQTAVDPAIREIEKQTRQNLISDSAAAARAGAFGGSRQGLREAETITEGSRLAGDTRAQAGARGLEFAAGRFDQDRSARFTAEDAMRAGFETDEASRLRATQELQGFAPLVQGLQEQAASGLITAGQAKRQLDQMALDMAYSDYVEQREYPFQMVNFALGALQGVPYETRTIGLESGNQYVQNPSVYGQTVGGLGSLASAYYLGNRS
tara:strand:- start:2099 stop:3160 length:1062 start_codon:yes stop_codon:yes gene_type:complete